MRNHITELLITHNNSHKSVHYCNYDKPNFCVHYFVHGVSLGFSTVHEEQNRQHNIHTQVAVRWWSGSDAD